MFWPFRRQRSLEESGFFRGFVDWHSHLLPGVDDGVQTLDESLRVLALYEQLGVREVWLTPHIMEDIPNTTSFLRERFCAFRQAYTGSILLHLAAENMLDALFGERLAANDLLPIGRRGDHLLVETSCFSPPMDLCGMLRRIQSCGYHPVLAHPERYLYMDQALYRKLRSMGVKMQLNLFSFLGSYGKEAKSKAYHLVDDGYIHLTGTDIHALHSFQNLMSMNFFAAAAKLKDMNKDNVL